LSRKSGDMSNLAYEQPLTRSKAAVNGDALAKEMGNGGGRVWRDGSVEDSTTDLRARKAGTAGPSSSKARTSKSPTPSVHSPYNGLPTLPTVFDNDQESEGPGSPESPALTGTSSRPPPPAASTMTAQGKPVTRKRRSSSIVRKPSPGAVPTKAVDWEIPRKTLHSSIGKYRLPDNVNGY
jgi:diacylglycerol kinase (CTP)